MNPTKILQSGLSEAPILLVSFSGGRTSAMMARMIQISPCYAHYRKVYCFANTGKEREETLQFVQLCDENWGFETVWLEAAIHPELGKGTSHRIVTYETALRNTDPVKPGHPFFDLCSKYGIPSNSAPHCTRELKAAAIASYMCEVCRRSYCVEEVYYLPYTQAWGIRADEPSRLTKRPGVIYPLADLGITEPIVRSFWDRQSFDLGLKDYQGNCDLCFKKSLRKRLTMLRETPEIAEDWAMLEKAGFRPDKTKGRASASVFDRNGLTVPDLLKLSQDPTMENAVDKHDARIAEGAIRPELFNLVNEIDWDFETHCHCRTN